MFTGEKIVKILQNEEATRDIIIKVMAKYNYLKQIVGIVEMDKAKLEIELNLLEEILEGYVEKEK